MSTAATAVVVKAGAAGDPQAATTATTATAHTAKSSHKEKIPSATIVGKQPKTFMKGTHQSQRTAVLAKRIGGTPEV